MEAKAEQNSVLKWLCTPILLAMLLALQTLLNFLAYDYRGPSCILADVLARLGLYPDFTRMLLWYILQIGLTFAALALFVRQPLRELGFNKGNLRVSLTITAGIFIVYPLLYMGINTLLQAAGITAPSHALQGKSTAYIIQDLLCYSMLPGIGEEPLFRVFVIHFLAMHLFPGHCLRERKTAVWLVVISSLLFTVSHIYISWSPFFLQYNVVQLVLAFVLGVFYSTVYLATGSILAPILCHGYTDFVYRLAVLLLH